MDSGKHCGPCSRTFNTTPAAKYCKDCEEALCKSCFQVHGTFKPLLSHNIQDLEKEDPGLNIKIENHCTEHPSKTYKFYCADHETVCCKTCLGKKHTTCSQIKTLEGAAANVQTSTMFENFVNDINDLKSTFDNRTKEIEKEKNKLQENKDNVQKRIRQFKSKVLKMLDNLEKKLLSEVSSIYAKHLAEAESDSKNINNNIKELQDTFDIFNMLVKYNRNSDLLLFMCTRKEEIIQSLNRIKQQASGREDIEVEFVESNFLSTIKSLGSIAVKAGTQNIQNVPAKIKQSQRNYVPTKFKLDKSVEIKYQGQVQITGIGVTRDDRLLLCNWLNNKLLIYTDKMQYEEDIMLAGKPWGIAVVPNTDEAWVTLPEQSSMQLVNATTLKIESPVRIPFGCYGITLIEEFIALGRWREIVIVCKDGRCFRKIEIGKETMHALSTGSDGQIYCCEGDGGMFHCVGLDGTILFSNSPPQLQWPVNVSSDVQGNLYVLGLQSNNVYRISPDGRLMGVVLQEEDGIKLPFAVAFNRNYSKLFISNESGKFISIFWCKYV